MLDISYARRLTTIAKKRIEEQNELEYEVLSEWEQRAIEFMSDPYLHDILMEFVDNSITRRANCGNSSCLIVYGRWSGIYDNSYEVILYNASDALSDHLAKEINALIDTYDFMSTSDTDTILQLLWATLSEIIIPVYEESYAVDQSNHSSTEHWIRIDW